MKRKFTILLAFVTLILVLAFSACSVNDSDTDTQTDSATSTITDTSTASETETQIMETETDTATDVELDTETNTATDVESDIEASTETDTESEEHTHTEEIIPAVEANCTESGLTEGKKCSECGEIIVEQEIIEAGHTEEIIPVVEATCTQTGLTEGKKCSTCGEVLIEPETIDTIEHNYLNKVCTICGEKQASEGLEYKLNETTNTYAVTGIGTCTDTNIVIPSIYEGKEVTSIEKKAFQSNKRVISIEIPDSVTIIGKYAFYDCQFLTNITIHKNVLYIGENAFHSLPNLENVNYIGSIEDWCNIEFYNEDTNPLSYGSNLFINGELLTNLVIPSTVTKIKPYVFYGCGSLESVTIPNSVTSIGYNAFSRCISLASVTIPDSVTIISSYAFSNCISLTSITIPDSVTKIGTYAFEYCYKLVEIYNLSSLNITAGASSNGKIGFYAKVIHTSLDEESVLKTTEDGCVFAVVSEDEIYLIDYIGNETELTLPESYNGNNYNIYQYAFDYNKNIIKVTIPNTIMSIGDHAFSGCKLLKSIVIGNGVTYIGTYAFGECERLVEVYNLSSLTITVGSFENGWIGRYAKVVYNSLDEESKLKTTEDGYVFAVISDSEIYLVDYIGSETELILPESYDGNIYEINQYAFLSRDDITKIIISNSVTSIGIDAFAYCTSLTSIVIPDSVTSIGEAAFLGCISLTSIVIPDSITSIGYNAFSHCVSLASVNYLGNVEGWCNILFSNNSSNPLYYAKDLYFNGELVTNLVIPDAVTEINDYTFCGCSSLVRVTIPNSITSIGHDAFSNCTSLTSVTIPDSVTSIENDAFEYCDSLTIYCKATSKPNGWSSNWNVSDCPVYWYSETEPTGDGNYWHYVDGVVTVWE